MYQALYRKWRPRTFDDVVGQPHITETLKRQVSAGRLSHAYLFTGTRGTGKTTCAKLLARAANCEHPVNGNPCNQCPACRGIENGSILDVLELDAASNNGVDQIRSLRDEAAYTPAAVRKRVYIVDEVHMLSIPAFNALLKILEEPPPHLMFILATTELHKVPATIKSRCQQFAFKRISPKAIAGQLAHVAEQEGIALTTPAAELLARLADGGLRDGLSLLDQCSGTQQELTEAAVLDHLGLAGNQNTAELLDAVAQEDTNQALSILDALYQDGKDMGALLGELTALVRDLLIRKTAPEGGNGLLIGGYEDGVIRSLAKSFTSAELVQMMTILQAAQADLYRSSSRRLDAELCLIRLCDRRLSDTTEGLFARLSRLEARLDSGSIAPAPKNTSSPSHPVSDPIPASPPPKPQRKAVKPASKSVPKTIPEAAPPWDEELPPPSDADLPPAESELPPWETEAVTPPAAPQKPKPPKAPAPPEATAKPDPEPEAPPASPSHNESWPQFLKSLPDLPPMVHAFLFNPDSVTGVFGPHHLTLWTDSDLTKSFLNRGETPALLEQAAVQYTGRKLHIKFQVGTPQPETQAAPSAPPVQDNFQELLEHSRKFDDIIHIQ